ncbi:MAG TPA: hypothetical protein VFN21_01940, partial [Acidimicrobiales bacterium]|nr:hypothetical protein [Acidimicrobiales bacterium]
MSPGAARRDEPITDASIFDEPTPRLSDARDGSTWLHVARALLVAAASCAMAVFRYRAWDRSFSVPLATAGTDHLYIASVVRSIDATGWYFTNPHLGAPFGQQLYDFPQTGESIQLLALRFLTSFSDRPFWVMNVYFLFGFAAVAFVTYLVLAHLRFRFGVAAAVAILYSWLPYHFMHGEFHLFRSAYLSAPIGVLLIFWALSWKDRFLVDATGPVWGVRRLVDNLRWPRVWGAAALCVFVGGFETMVMAFVLTALVASAVVSTIRNRDVGDLGVALANGVLIAGTFAVLFVPNWLYKFEHGPNTEAAARYPAEQINYGLSIAKMVLPVPFHHIDPLGRLLYRSQTGHIILGEDGQNLGLLGALGLLVLLYGVIVNRLDTRAGDAVFARRRLWVQSGLITMVLVLFGTMGGFALILSTLGLSQIRMWDRVVILIAFCAYLIVAVGLERFGDRFQRRIVESDGPRAARANRRLVAGTASAALLVAVVAFGLWDTNSQYSDGSQNAAYDRQAHELKRFDEAMTAHLGSTAAIFQLPVVAFPEAPAVERLRDYEELLPYLYSKGLRFSYGATRGRPDADWQHRVDSHDPGPSLPGLVGLGFSGVLVDSFG